MSPALISLVISLVEEAVKIEPTLAAELSALFSNTNPTPVDWQALRTKVLGESFASLAPNAAANLAPAGSDVTGPVTIQPAASQAASAPLMKAPHVSD